MGLSAGAPRATSQQGSSWDGRYKPLCPPSYHFDYDWQSCWPNDAPPRKRPAKGSLWEDACRCEAGYSWLADSEHCWKRGSLPGVVFQPSPVLGAGAASCEPDEYWDEILQICQKYKNPYECPEGSTWDDTDPLADPGCVKCYTNTEWTFDSYAWDCNEDDLRMIGDAITRSLEVLRPAVNMLEAMKGDDAYALYLWNYDFDAKGSIRRAASPREWLGPYTETEHDMLHAALTTAIYRFTIDPQLIRCQKSCKRHNAYYTAGRIHLCKPWFDEDDAEERAKTMVHEALHVALPFWYVNMPRDVRESICWHTPPNKVFPTRKCYGRDNAEKLANRLDIKRWVLNQETSHYHRFFAAGINVDNIVEWLFGRSSQYFRCTLPIGALTRAQFHGFP